MISSKKKNKATAKYKVISIHDVVLFDISEKLFVDSILASTCKDEKLGRRQTFLHPSGRKIGDRGRLLEIDQISERMMRRKMEQLECH